jgi:hypothetical protein
MLYQGVAVFGSVPPVIVGTVIVAAKSLITGCPQSEAKAAPVLYVPTGGLRIVYVTPSEPCTV